MTANELTASLLIEIPKRFPQARVWRQNTGAGVAMESVKKAIACINRGSYREAIGWLVRPIKFGILGGADISGIMSMKMGAVTVGLRMEIEVKVGKDRQSEEQRGFQEMILAAGGIYILARDVEQCIAELGRWEI